MFFYIIIVFLILNLVWYLGSDYCLRHDLINYPRARKYTRLALLAWMLIIFIPIISTSLGLGNPLESGPWIWTSILYLWVASIILWMPGVVILGFPIWGFKRLKRVVKDIKAARTADKKESYLEQPAADNHLSRRQFVKLGLLATPPLLVSGVSVVTYIAQKNLNIRTIDLPVINLPPDLEGYTITHLSDTHVGILTSRERVENIVRTANQLKSNLTVITGDILDNNFDYMPDLIDTIGELRAEQGVYMCIGNHDKIYDEKKWVSTIRRAGFNLLLDESVIIDTGGTPIKLLGIDYTRNESQNLKNIQRADQYTLTPDQNLKVLLAHHPHAFDAAPQANIPLTLSGHTHGGQLALRIGEEYELFNAGNYLFRYVDGFYQKEKGHSLFVHRGSGDWFPLRTGVPTEVVQLRLVAGK